MLGALRAGTLAIFVLAPVDQASPATIAAADCSSKAVQSAINRASNGDTVTVPAGTCTWRSQVTVSGNKGIVLQGAGAGKTIIEQGLVDTSILKVSVAEGRFTRVTGFTFDQKNLDIQGQASVNFEVDGLDAFRVDNNVFINIRERAIGVSASDVVEISGLIDHNTFECRLARPSVCQSVFLRFCGSQENDLMRFPEALGSKKYVFFEDNVMNYSYVQDGTVEGYGCSRYVARFNAFHGASQGHHGNDTGNRRGTQSFEIYHNTFDTQGLLRPWSGRVHHIRSGTGVIFNNTYSNDIRGGLSYYLYRVDRGYRVYGKCDGTSPWDGNDGSGSAYPARGYPCIDSPCWVFNDKAGKSGGKYHLAPCYSWGNKNQNGLQHPVAGTGHPTHIAADVEFFDEKADFNGSSGVGIGTRAKMDAITCTKENVGFWVTDEGEWNSTNGSQPDGRLYRCVSGKWMLYYTPYTYPHPLQLSSPRGY
jgi:hypothetical protein